LVAWIDVVHGGPGGRVALALVSYAFWVAMVGTTLPTPLYPLYEHEFGFTPFVITIIFATYAVGVIAALVLLGGLSDTLGRRPLLMLGLALSAASAGVFLIASGLTPLLVGRLLSGLSAGVFTGTGTAALADLAGAERRSLASGIATAANLGGLGCGTLLAGALAAWAPLPLRLPFLVDLGLLIPAAVAVAAVPEPVSRRGHASLRIQRLRVPRPAQAIFMSASLAGFASIAMSGLFSSLAPAFLARSIGLSSPAISGAVVFALFSASAAGQLGVSRTPAALLVGCVGTLIGTGLVAVALAFDSFALLLGGAIVAGLGQGLSVGGGIDALNAAAPATHRAEIASSFFVVLYVAISIPIVGMGLTTLVLGLRGAGLVLTAFVATVGIACLASLLAQRLSSGRTRAPSTG
jgi:predicted MFS family arabinose efflux permease